MTIKFDMTERVHGRVQFLAFDLVGLETTGARRAVLSRLSLSQGGVKRAESIPSNLIAFMRAKGVSPCPRCGAGHSVLMLFFSLFVLDVGMGWGVRCLDMNRSEPAIVNGTREVQPGLIFTGACGDLGKSEDVVFRLAD